MEEKVSLYCTNARSDKEYHMQLVAQGGGFMVYAQNGPRGGTLTHRSKTKEPVPYDKAKKEFDTTLKSKLKDGYSTGEAGTAFVGTDQEGRFTGVLPQLLNAISEEEAEQKISDDRWVAQEKHDGHRRGLSRDAKEELLGINRKGLAVGLPETAVAACAHLCAGKPLKLDGELMGDRYAIFDVREFEGLSTDALPYSKRLDLLETVSAQLQAAGISHETIWVTPTARTTAQKRALFDKIKAEGGEGVVFKLLDAKYEEGRPASGGSQLKRKFTARDSFIVKARHSTKRSISLAALDDEGKLVDVGNCTLPANAPEPAVGAIVDVEYLYAFPGGSLFQPQFRQIRDDIDQSDCKLSRLRYKQGTTGDDGDDSDQG